MLLRGEKRGKSNAPEGTVSHCPLFGELQGETILPGSPMPSSGRTQQPGAPGPARPSLAKEGNVLLDIVLL